MSRHPDLQPIRTRLLAWYRRNRRDLPWRGADDPYAVWVSEIMLQQTRVETVGPYYRRFLERFPNVPSLAAAKLDDVLKLWEGLGYYARARNLHRAARQLVAERGAELPRDPAELRKLPGIGRYTAGAIASIAFGLDEPVLDGNVTRVLSRVFRIRRPPDEPATQRRLWKLARDLIPRGKASLINQAMMDLGATVCRPRNPLCLTCPLRNDCRALARGEQTKLPVRQPSAPLPHQTVVAAVIRRRGRVLIDRRPPEGLLGGLWEFPGGKVEPGESLQVALAREVREEVGLTVRVGERLMSVKHAYTHFRITLHFFACTAEPGRARALACQAVRWARPADLPEYAFPKASHAMVRHLAHPAAGRP